MSKAFQYFDRESKTFKADEIEIADVGGLQAALDAEADATDLAAHIANTSNPHGVTKSQVGLGNVDNTSDINKPVSTAQAAADSAVASTAAAAISSLASAAAAADSAVAAAAAADLAAHEADTANPHNVTKSQVGLGNVDNTSDANKPVSTAQAAADSAVAATAAAAISSLASAAAAADSAVAAAAAADLAAHEADTANPHNVTKSQVGLGNVDNTSDTNKPVSTAQAAADSAVGTAAAAALATHAANTSNPHSVTKSQVGLGNVDNTSDADKPVSTAQAAADSAVLSSARSYADGLVTGLWDDRGSFDASGNAFPSSGGSGSAGTILKGDIWTISVAGTLGGHSVGVGDTVRALVDSPGSTDANWAIGENNLGFVPENSANKNASGGYAGLSLFKIILKNALGTVSSFFQTAATMARTWTFPDKDGTVAMTSDITGTNSGTNTGDQSSVSGNAGTATALQTSRTINGVAFDGTSNITVPAAGSTLTDTVPIAKGGTGQTTAAAAFNALKPQLKITYTGTPGVPMVFPLCPGMAVVPVAAVSGQATYVAADGPTVASITIPQDSIIGPNALTTLSFDDLVGIQGTLTNGPNLNVMTGLSFPELLYIGNSFTLSGMLTLTTLSLPKLINIGGSFSPNLSGLTSVSFPALVSCGAGVGSFNPTFAAATSVSMPNLTYVLNNATFTLALATTLTLTSLYLMQGNNQFTCAVLVTLSLPALAYNIGQFTVSGCPLMTTFSAPSMIVWGSNIAMNSSNGNLASITLGTIGTLKQIAGTTITLSGQKLTSANVNAIMALLVSLNGSSGTTAWGSGKTLTINGGTNGAPTGQGITDKATLVARGATITTN